MFYLTWIGQPFYGFHLLLNILSCMISYVAPSWLSHRIGSISLLASGSNMLKEVTVRSMRICSLFVVVYGNRPARASRRVVAF